MNDTPLVLVETLNGISDVLRAGGLSPAASGRSREEVQAALAEWLGVEPHEEIIEFFTFAEQWLGTPVAPNVYLEQFDEPTMRDSYLDASNEPWDEGYNSGDEGLARDWVWAGSDRSGYKYAFAPASAAGPVPRVLQYSAGSFGVFIADRDGRASTLVTDWQRLPSLTDWVNAMLAGHRSGAIVTTDGSSRPADVTPSTNHRWSYPWPPRTVMPPTSERLEPSFTLDRTRLNALALSPDHTQLMTSDHDGLIELWNPTNGERLGWFDSGYKRVRAVEWAPGGTAVVVAGDLGGSTCWSIASGQSRWTLTEGLVSPSRSHDTLLVTKLGNKARLWDVESQSLAYESEHNVDYSRGFSPSGAYVALVGAARRRVSGDLWIVSTSTGEVIFESSVRDSGEQQWAWGGGWSTNDRWFAFAAGHEVRLFDVDTQRVSAVPTAFRSLVSGMRWSPDGQQLAVIHEDAGVEVCSFDDEGETAGPVSLVPTGIPFAKLARGAKLTGAISWAPDSSRLVSSMSTDRAARIFDVASGEVDHLLQALPEWFGQLEWSPAGHFLMSQSIGETRIWDASTATNLHLLNDPCASKAAVWGPDDTYLIGLDSIVCRWDVR